MDEDTIQLNRELAGFAGITDILHISNGDIVWVEKGTDIPWCTEYFTSSLDSCFRFLLQPVCDHFIGKSGSHTEFQLLVISFLEAWVRDFVFGSLYQGMVEPKGQALAFCKAAKEVLDKN